MAKSIRAAKVSQDEFYTQLSDIEEEVRHYWEHFRDQVVYCNCDDPRISNFYRYFRLKFEPLGLRRLITTCYQNESSNLFSQHNTEQSVGIDYDGDTEREFQLEGDGDFRSDECVALLRQADIVVTNPPFSLWREYIAQLVEYKKRFLVIGNKNAITYKEVFPLIRDGKLWVGTMPLGQDMLFDVPKYYAEMLISSGREGSGYRVIDGMVKARATAIWFTNLPHSKRKEELVLFRRYNPEVYPKYDNYDAINVDRVADIPGDYFEPMGVPITFVDKYNPEQFEIIRFRKGDDGKDLSIDGKCPYFRIIIRRVGT